VFSVTQSSSYSVSQNYLTDVGAFTGSGSFYGTFDQSGDVFQWNDLDGQPGSTRGLRGGSWGYYVSTDTSSAQFAVVAPSTESGSVGFRLAGPVVPEPSTYALACTGLACWGWQIFRFRRAR